MASLRDLSAQATGGPRPVRNSGIPARDNEPLEPTRKLKFLQHILAPWLREQMQTHGRYPLVIQQDPHYMRLYWNMRDVAFELRAEVGHRLWEDSGERDRYPDWLGDFPYSEVSILRKAKSILKMDFTYCALSQGVDNGTFKVGNVTTQRPIIAALQVFPNGRIPHIYLDSQAPEKHVIWEAACLMGYYIFNYEILVGSPGGTYATPDPTTAMGRNLVPPLHAFAKALLHRWGLCPADAEGRSLCGCNELEWQHNAAPANHPQDSTWGPALNVQRIQEEIQRTSGMPPHPSHPPMPTPVTPPTMPDSSTPPNGIRQRKHWNAQHTPRPGPLDDEGEF